MSKHMSAIAVLFTVLTVCLGIGTGVCLSYRGCAGGESACDRASLLDVQDRLQRRYADTLRRDIVRTLERVTGAGTVAATVRADLGWETTDSFYQKDVWRDDVRRSGDTVDRLSVAVLVDDRLSPGRYSPVYRPRPTEEMTRLTDLVRAIIGFDATRGDRLSVQNMPFDSAQRPALGLSRRALILGTAIFLSVVFAVFLFGLSVMIRRRRTPSSAKVYLLGRLLRLIRHHPDLAAAVFRRWLKHQVRPSARQYALAERAGIIALILGAAEMRLILDRLTDDEVSVLERLTARLGHVTGRDIQASLALFHSHLVQPPETEGTPSAVKDLLHHRQADSQRSVPADTRTLSAFLDLDSDKIKRLLACCDRAVLSGALADESQAVRAFFARHLTPGLWQSVAAAADRLPPDFRRQAKDILFKTAQALNLFD